MKLLSFFALFLVTLTPVWAQKTFTGTIDLLSAGVEASTVGTQYEYQIYNEHVGGSYSGGGTFVLGAGGSYSFSVPIFVETGPFRVLFRTDYVPNVNKRFDVTVPFGNPATIPLPTWIPKLGDIDSDNEIGVGDYAALSASFNTWVGHENWDAWSDLNQDGFVDAMDYSILSSNYGAVGDDY